MKEDFILIAGPCSAESEDQVLTTAKLLKESVNVKWFRAGVWKPRTRPGGFEGLGSQALPWLERVQKEIGLPVITEVGNAQHVKEVLNHGIKAFWIGARTVSNPFSIQDVIEATEDKDVSVLIKNTIYPDIELWSGAIERFLNAGFKNIYAVHRGFFPYEKTHLRNVQKWEIPIELSRRFPNIPIICDPSHIAGSVEYLKEISQQALNLNMTGLMIESHYSPSTAITDSKQQIKPQELKTLISELIFSNISSEDNDFLQKLAVYRESIDIIDFQLIDMLTHRFKLTDEIGEIKKNGKVTILQIDRWKTIVESRLKYANNDVISKEFLLKVLQLIHKESITRQNKLFTDGSIENISK